MDLKDTFKELPYWLRKPNPNIYKRNDYLYYDIESTNTEKGTAYAKANRIVCVSWCVGKDHEDYRKLAASRQGPVQLHWGAPDFRRGPLAEALQKSSFLCAHNQKFDYAWLVREGWKADKPLFCTLNGEWTIQGNRQYSKTLDNLLARYGLGSKVSTVSKLIKLGVSPSEIPKTMLAKYSIEDTRLGNELFLAQRAILERDGLLPVVFTKNIVIPVLVEIERNGMHLDANFVNSVYSTYNQSMGILEEKLREVIGDVNTKSPLQMNELIYKKLKFKPPVDYKGKVVKNEKSGLYPTGIGTLRSLKANTSEQKKFIKLVTELNKVRDVKSKTLDKMRLCVDETKDGIIRANINQGIAQNHRFSSTGKTYAVQFQNVARDWKGLFSARYPNYSVAEADYSQLEFRVAVDLARDKQGYEDIINKVDVHSVTASIMFNKDIDKVTSSERTEAKAHTFKPLYYGRSGTEDQKRYYKEFRKKYVDISVAQERWINEVASTKQLRTVTGLIFYFPDANRDPRTGWVDFSNHICNYPVSNLATAEMVPIGLTYQYYLMKAAGLRSFLVNTVHDSTISEVADEEIDDYRKIVKYALESCVKWYLAKVYGIKVGVPIETEINIGKNWKLGTDKVTVLKRLNEDQSKLLNEVNE